MYNLRCSGSKSIRKDGTALGEYAAGKQWKEEKEQRILDTAFRLFSERGIGAVTMPEIAEAANVGRATLYRYFSTKMDLVVAVSTQQWESYIAEHGASVPQEVLDSMTGAEYLKFFMDAFLELYRSRKDILRFNYDFNSYLRHVRGTLEQRLPFLRVAESLGAGFHEIYRRGRRDGTLNTEISEAAMFSGMMHIMLAAATRYAIGLVYLVDQSADPEEELRMLEELLLSKYTKQN